MQALNERVRVKRLSNAVAAGTTDVNSTSVDMGADNGYRGCMFYVAFGTITASAVTSVKVQTSSDNSTFNDLEGTSVTVADDDDNQIFIVDVVEPNEQYLRVTVDRGTANAVIDGIWSVQYGPNRPGTTHDATTVGASEVHLSPAEGTA